MYKNTNAKVTPFGGIHIIHKRLVSEIQFNLLIMSWVAGESHYIKIKILTILNINLQQKYLNPCYNSNQSITKKIKCKYQVKYSY